MAETATETTICLLCKQPITGQETITLWCGHIFHLDCHEAVSSKPCPTPGCTSAGPFLCVYCQGTITLPENNEGKVVTFPCGHYFHSACVQQWVDTYNTCPTCRKPVNAEQPVAVTQYDPDNYAPGANDFSDDDDGGGGGDGGVGALPEAESVEGVQICPNEGEDVLVDDCTISIDGNMITVEGLAAGDVDQFEDEAPYDLYDANGTLLAVATVFVRNRDQGKIVFHQQ